MSQAAAPPPARAKAPRKRGPAPATAPAPGPGGSPAPATPAGAAPTGPAPSAQGAPTAAAAIRGVFSDTPGRMRLLGALAALAALLFGAVAIVTLVADRAAASRASETTAQVVRVQGVYADLLLADATATNGFLVGGLEPPAQRATYEQAMDRVVRGIAAAAQAQPADGTALAALSTHVQSYGQLVEQARAYNRQGLPVGAQYLTLASDGLRADAVPVLKALVEANTARSAGELDRAAMWWPLALAGLLTLGVLAAALTWLAKRTHRYVNVPMAVAAAAVAITLGVGLMAIWSAGRTIQSTRDDQLAATVALAGARTAAYDAKANESLTLIKRGSGAAFETKWQAAATTVKTALDDLSALPSGQSAADQLAWSWSTYVGAHQAIRAADDGGSWDTAVTQASATGPATANGSFATFDTTSADAVDLVGAEATARLGTAGDGLRTSMVLALLAALAAAVLALRGVSQRIEEYR